MALCMVMIEPLLNASPAKCKAPATGCCQMARFSGVSPNDGELEAHKL